MTERLTERVLEYIGKYNMLPEGGAALCAVSGGTDSMCMLTLLRELGYGVVCAHFNHRLRGEESDRDEAFVRDFCEKAGIAFYSGSADVAAYASEMRLSIEAAARRRRYAFLEDTARSLGLDRIATAHTAWDNAETILLNLVRGSGARGLSGIPPVRSGLIAVIRPLLCLTRPEIEDYLCEKGIPHIEDSSNDSDDYTRNYLRHNVMPLLRGLNPRFEQSALSLGELLREDDEFLRSLALDFLDGGGFPIDAAASLPRPVLSRAIREFVPVPLSRAHTEAAEFLILSGSVRGSIDVPGGRLVKEYGFMRFIDETAVSEMTATEIKPGDTLFISGIGKHLECRFIEKCTDINSSFNIFYFKNDTVHGRITVRPRAQGDKLRLAGRKTRSLKKLFSEAKIPLARRALTPVFADEDGVIAVQGLGVAERCVPEPGDDVIRIEFYDQGRTDC